MNDIIVYTCIFGDYDDLKDPPYISKNCDYVCFTDNPKFKSNVWKQIYVNLDDLPQNLRNRYIKLLPHRYFKEYDYSVYIDGNIDIIGDINILIEKYLTDNILACPFHSQRNCIYEEAKACIELKKDDETTINNQMDKYHKLGYPKNNGLTATYVLLRKHNEKQVVSLMEDWWKELISESMRDQLSFCYIAWKHDFKFKIMDENADTNNYFIRRLHKKTYFSRVWRTFTKSLKMIRI